MAIDRFRFGSAVALGLLALSILKLPVGSAPLLVVAVTALFAFEPDANADGDHAPDDAPLGQTPAVAAPDGGDHDDPTVTANPAVNAVADAADAAATTAAGASANATERHDVDAPDADDPIATFDDANAADDEPGDSDVANDPDVANEDDEPSDHDSGVASEADASNADEPGDDHGEDADDTFEVDREPWL